ncbi:glycoside hydrolase family 67 protein [Penicillium odoratum]|uniref:glycoside hydrolase family 67 protein n=1 Tax=Penicillium odoratum TaxID=1167516 RepID=UPI0025486EF4|nr:glycoside hydrolase family 67 protein [Penicillium odoratum]KAJ5764727.1 glycoside hydrolase family 67 protein [Penicillium odoratum]
MPPSETGIEAWLRYVALPADVAAEYCQYSSIIALIDNESSSVHTAGKGLQLGMSKILGQNLNLRTGLLATETVSSIIIGTVKAFASAGGDVHDLPNLKADGLILSCKRKAPVKILGQNERGAVYGAFELLMLLSRNECVPELYASSPSAPIRWVNEWDKLDGTIERGYGGPSIYFKDGFVIDDLTRANQYARLLASFRLNGIIVNNVNSDSQLFNPKNMKGLGRIADIMRVWGVRIGIALYFDTPIHGRTLADGVNLFARALKKHGDGMVMANAAVEFFDGQDTEFEDKVLIQIKYGQINFQQQDHVVYLPPLWRIIFEFDLQIDDKPSLVRDIVSGQRFNWSRAAYATVVNIGNDPTWLGSHLAMSNLYAYGRYTWNPQSDETCHFGPSPATHDGNGWGQWSRADEHALGMDRTVATARFEDIDTTPDELLLWFHHVPYTHVLKSGKTVIQQFYDAHYDGARAVQTFLKDWEALLNTFYHAKCGIDDERGRVGNHPWRIEGEDMELEGYEVESVTPFEDASGSRAIVTVPGVQLGTAKCTVPFVSGIYDVAVNYYDHLGGTSQYQIFLNDRLIGSWAGDLEEKLGHDFSDLVDGYSATRITFKDVKVNKGDRLKIIGKPNGPERAPIDYVSLLPNGVVD